MAIRQSVREALASWVSHPGILELAILQAKATTLAEDLAKHEDPELLARFEASVQAIRGIAPFRSKPNDERGAPLFV